MFVSDFNHIIKCLLFLGVFEMTILSPAYRSKLQAWQERPTMKCMQKTVGCSAIKPSQCVSNELMMASPNYCFYSSPVNYSTPKLNQWDSVEVSLHQGPHL